jgi:hypothetical protein
MQRGGTVQTTMTETVEQTGRGAAGGGIGVIPATGSANADGAPCTGGDPV